MATKQDIEQAEAEIHAAFDQITFQYDNVGGWMLGKSYEAAAIKAHFIKAAVERFERAVEQHQKLLLKGIIKHHPEAAKELDLDDPEKH